MVYILLLSFLIFKQNVARFLKNFSVFFSRISKAGNKYLTSSPKWISHIINQSFSLASQAGLLYIIDP